MNILIKDWKYLLTMKNSVLKEMKVQIMEPHHLIINKVVLVPILHPSETFNITFDVFLFY